MCLGLIANSNHALLLPLKIKTDRIRLYMSLFLKIQRLSAKPKIIAIRSMNCEIGEDRQGILNFENPDLKFFAIYASDDKYLIKPLTNKIYCQDEILLDGQINQLSNGQKIKVNDYEFTFVFGDNTAEALAHSNQYEEVLKQSLENIKILKAQIHLAGLSKSYQLLPNIVFTIGSSAEANIKISTPGVEKKHCQLIQQNQDLIITPLKGKVFFEGQEIAQETVLDLSNLTGQISLSLPPSDLVVYLGY